MASERIKTILSGFRGAWSARSDRFFRLPARSGFSIRRHLAMINALFIASALIGIVGAWEISNGAKLHEVNFLHVKYSHAFMEARTAFVEDGKNNTEELRNIVALIRRQPIECLKIAGPVARIAMRFAGAHDAIGLCERDVALGDNTLDQLHQFDRGSITRDELLGALAIAEKGFFDNSSAFEPMVTRTVSFVLFLMMGLITVKGVFIAGFGAAIAREAGENFRSLEIANRKVTEANDRFHLAVEGSSVGLWDWRVGTGEFYWSPRLKDILGVTDEIVEPDFETFISCIADNDRERVRRAIEQHTADHGLFDLECQLRRMDDSLIWIHLRGQAVWDHAGKPIRMAGSVDDITESHRLQEKVVEQKEELRLIFENVPSRIWFKDSHNKILRLNKQAADSMGVSIEEAEGADTYDLFPKMAKKYHMDDLEVINGGKPKLGILEEYTPKSGVHGWVRTDKIPHYDADADKQFLLVVATDVTKEKYAEEALRLSEERFALAAKGSIVGIWDWVDTNADAVWWSPILFEMLGYENGEITSSFSRFDELLHPDDKERALQQIGRHLTYREPFRSEYRLRHKTNGYRWFLVAGQAEWGADGGATRMIGSLMDIHELKSAQEKLEMQARILAQANKELDNFAYIASHDLRAPLRGMDNMAQWVLDDLGDAADEGAKKKLDLLRNRVGRMNNLLTDILTFSRAGRQLGEPDIIDCGALIASVMEWVDIPPTFSVNVSTEMPTALFHRTVMEQIFTNLISNAVKHHDRADGVIDIRYEEHSKMHRFTIEDDGAGIPEKFQTRVFEMFQTLRPRDQIEGSGIGLAIVKKLVETGGGDVTLISPVTDRGAKFQIALPKITSNYQQLTENENARRKAS